MIYLKGKCSFYIAQYPVRWTAQSALQFFLFAFPGRPVHSDTNSASPGSILVRQQLRAKTKSLTCPPLSIARYSCILRLAVSFSALSNYCNVSYLHKLTTVTVRYNNRGELTRRPTFCSIMTTGRHTETLARFTISQRSVWTPWWQV